MESLVNNIFAICDLKVSAKEYFKLVEKVDSLVGEIPCSEYTSAILSLENIDDIGDSPIYRDRLISVIQQLNAAAMKEIRERLLLCYLGMIICYFYLGDKQSINTIKSVISPLAFEASFWELNGNDIKKLAVGLGGLAIVVASGGSAAIGAGLGASAYHMLGKDWPSMRTRKDNFDTIKKAILALNFV